jgi:pullulanase
LEAKITKIPETTMRLTCSLVSQLKLFVAAGTVTALAACGGGNGTDATATPQASRLASTVTLGGTVAVTAAAVAPPAAGNIRMHFHRVQNDAAQWGVYSWDGPVTPSSAWISDRFMLTQTTASAATSTSRWPPARGDLVPGHRRHRQQELRQRPAADLNADVASAGQEVWMLEGDCTVYNTPPAISFGNLNSASAHWLSATTLAWPGVPPTGASYRLYYATNGGLGASARRRLRRRARTAASR